ncbi:MAG: response regulator [Magnetococcales bacterium]|nr:response regulator [Magnetococcales bacterium]
MDGTKQPNILIVDDKPANLKALRAVLSSMDAHIIEALSGNAALGLMLEFDIALVLLDVNMPGMDGFEVARIAQTLERTKEIPILFITAAYQDTAHQIEGYRSGAVDYIEKPLNGEVLRAKVSLFLRLYNSRTESDRLRKEYEELTARIPVGTYTFRIRANGSMAFEYVSEPFCRLLGLDRQAVLHDAASAFNAVHPEELETFVRLNQEAGEKRQPFLWVGRFLVADQVRWIHIESLPRLEESGDSIWNGVVIDITERKQMEDALRQSNDKLENRVQERTTELERSNRDLQQFAYVASHDLQEPLRQVSGFAQLLARRYQGRLDEKADEYIAYMVDGTRYMQELIEALLSFSRIHTSVNTLQAVDCEQVLAQVVRNMAKSIKSTNAVITHDPLPILQVDPFQMHQILQNLLTNAIKFRAEAPPRIHIEAKHQREEWLFSVQDNGIGIEPRHQERIFTIFQRLHTRTQYPGTGIGLAICKRIVERHGGQIWVKSEAGQGSTFFFTIKHKPVQES